MDAYCGHELTHQRLEAHREIFSRATAAARWSWPSVGGESGLCGGHSVVAAFGCTLARPAGAVSQRRDLLAALAALAGAGGLGKHGGNCCANWSSGDTSTRSEEHTSELQSPD